MSKGCYENGRYVTQGMQVCAALAAAVQRDAIVTAFVNPPIPSRDFDWSATRDGYDEGDPIGWGRTEAAAIDNLINGE
jgi:hypothetical protein